MKKHKNKNDFNTTMFACMLNVQVLAIYLHEAQVILMMSGYSTP